ncbi:hypothetical protein BTA51_27965 [Hahella sp. CCB-MM4]|uniref:bifunctional hydroxymethylpyrimidine kinase/phosphomethylpyrimidine kinase n=1 Tax=Hahella sp. (strain CCB-MM4) TaxID=1926491 RepID=UPI000B9C41F5|nr:hydroxymethylpyrimidine/phosphomethylpyrimidine kinase [Hahella sp. CCB-MM4]OZG70040.1 hypothetical protein BTA51_27965 [Hahella sp. CCB-MM4]
MPNLKDVPRVLSIGGLDPSGGAGIHADVKTINSLGGHATSLVTTHTVQDSQRVYAHYPVDTAILHAQLEKLFEDCPPQVIKVGALGNSEITLWLGDVFNGVAKNTFKVLDPVLSAGGGGSLSGHRQLEALKDHVLPHIDLLTPNTLELSNITGLNNETEAVQHLFKLGVRHVLITGGHEPDQKHIRNRCYSNSTKPPSLGDHLTYQEWQLSRVKGEFHGTGCTLASAIATLIGKGFPLHQAIETSQQWLTERVSSAYRVGHGQSYLNFLEYQQ